MKKKILIPTDFSKNAWNAIVYAADLYKDKECVFYILNAYSAATYSTSEMMSAEPGTHTYVSAKTISENGLANIVEMLDFREDNYKHTYEVVSEFNNLYSAIENQIEKRDIELVVMGTKGASDSDNRFFGSNTIVIMEKLRNCPVLGVPLGARATLVKEIVLPTSYKTHFKRKELINLVEVAQLHAATICVLHVSNKEDLTEEQLEKQALLEECIADTSYSINQVSGKDVAKGVQIFVESRGSDMVAFINKKHAFFGSVFSTPLVKELGMFSKVPLLVMHDLRN